jgi:hypothetical protein
MNETNTRHYYNCVKEFTESFGQRRYQFASQLPTPICELRISLIEEEEKEYLAGIAANNRLEMLDGVCDLIYVIAGTAVVCGIKPEPFTATEPSNLYTLERSIDALINELGTVVPCSKRVTRYSNDALQACDGRGIEHGFKLRDAFDVVHANNMDKLWTEPPSDQSLIVHPVRGKYLVKNKTGKVIKPPNHRKPDLFMFI